jgi:pimeloyl-ACP methyl ester carboxylesterase
MTGANGPVGDMLTVTSSDGTTIACSVGGDGPPIVLVHGTTGSDFSWALVRPHLEPRHTVVAVQRRGRGASGDGPVYAIEREAEDVAAVVDALGEPVVLVGHSHGATCCLEASLLTARLRRLVLYEPAIGWPIDEPTLQTVDAHVAAGRAEAAAETYLRDAAELTEDEIAMLRSFPTWGERVDAAHTFTREDRADAAYVAVAERLARMTVPTLLLTGGESPGAFRASIDELAAVLPGGTVQVIEGHGHAANVTAPDVLAAAILAFAGAGGAQG